MSLLLSIKKISFNRPGVGTGYCSPHTPSGPCSYLTTMQTTIWKQMKTLHPNERTALL